MGSDMASAVGTPKLRRYGERDKGQHDSVVVRWCGSAVVRWCGEGDAMIGLISLETELRLMAPQNQAV